MKKYSAIDHLLVQVPEKFESKIISKKGFEFYKDTAFAGVPDSVKYGIIVSVPDGYDYLQEGDVVYFHHNITYELVNYSDNRERSSFVLDGPEGIYFIPLDQDMIYAIERDGEFQALDGYCFVKEVLRKTTFGDFKIEHMGEMVYPSRSLTRLGIKKEDYVILKFYAEYPFTVKGEKLYRIREKSILGTWID